MIPKSYHQSLQILIVWSTVVLGSQGSAVVMHSIFKSSCMTYLFIHFYIFFVLWAA